MNWCQNLYWYAQERGGEFYGRVEGDYEGTLRTEYRDLPLLVSIAIKNLGRDGAIFGQAAFPVELERPYSLHIGPQNLLLKGAHLFREQVWKGFDRLNREESFTPEQGDALPEEVKGRIVDSSDAALTTTVLSDRELRGALWEGPKLGVEIGPSERGARTHLAVARVGLSQLHCDDGLSARVFGDAVCTAPEQKGGRPQFAEALDQLIALAYAARRAVAAWPMP